MSEARISAMVFDAYGTLFDLASALRDVEAELGPEGAKLGELWRKKQLDYSWLRSLMGRHVDFWQVTSDSLDYAIEALGLGQRAPRERLLAAFRRLHTYPEVPAVLDELRRRGLPTAILSNGEPGMLREAVDAAGLGSRLDHVLSVEAAGVFKPDGRVYALATRAFGVEPGRIGFVSSNGWDAHGAAAFGFRTFWVNRTGLPRERLPGDLAAVVADLTPLPDLVAGG